MAASSFLVHLCIDDGDTSMITSQRLTDAQLALLELFSFDMSEAEVVAMRQTLMQHFRQRLDDEAQQAMQLNGLTTEQLEAQLSGHNRTERLREIRKDK